MFSNDSKVQLAVLQERFKAHEQIIEKVDTAIQTLSETNQNICKMLAVHDERLEQCKTDDGELCKKVEDIENKLDGLYKFRWQAGGVLAVIVALIGIVNAFVPKLLTAPSTPATIERAK
jgi:DNA repair ATPase RecN